MHPLSLLLTDGSKSATNWVLLRIAGLASYLRALDDVQFSQKSNAKCLFLLLETLSATSFIKPKSNTTISTLSLAHSNDNFNRLQIRLGDTNKYIFRKRS
jgi:hypothetical protein